MTALSHCLWFDGQAEAAARFYVSLLPDSSIDRIRRYPADTPSGPEGAPMALDFTLMGNRYIALNGGRHFTLSPAFSMFVQCDGQDEIDRLWEALCGDGGTPSQCGWLTDRYGLSWQIVPADLDRLLSETEPDRARRVMQALMGMSRIDLAALRRAHGDAA